MASTEVKLAWDMAYAVFAQGDHERVSKGDDNEFVTRFELVLPLKDEEIEVGRFEPPRVCRRLFCLSHATIASSSIWA